MADQILTYVTQRRDNIKLALTASQQRFATAQASTVVESGKLEQATSAFADLEKKIAGIRQKLAAVPTPADGDLLLKDLEQAIIDSRAKQAEILAAQTALGAAQSTASLAQADLADLATQLTGAETLVQQADTAGKLRDTWIAALGGPLANIKTDAGNAADKTKNPLKKAKKRIEDDIPADLLKRAEA